MSFQDLLDTLKAHGIPRFKFGDVEFEIDLRHEGHVSDLTQSPVSGIIEGTKQQKEVDNRSKSDIDRHPLFRSE